MSKFCPKHGTEELRHLVNHCTCASKPFSIQLIGELIAVKPDKAEAQILLPDWKRSLTGRVLSVGSSISDIKEGDRVSFGAAVGMDSVYAGREVRILKERDIDFVYDHEA